MAGNVQRVEVFISGPADVAEERQLAVAVVERINRLSYVRNRFALIPHSYDTGAPAVVGHGPQTVVNEYMLRAREADIFVCILWRRFGTPLEDPETGQRFASGTEYEFSDAWRGMQARGLPRILLYRCTRGAEGQPDPRQGAQVAAFFRRFEGAQAEWQGLYRTFETGEEFAEKLHADLDAVLAAGDLAESASPVTFSGMLTNQGWLINLQTPEPAREILYRFGGAGEFHGTGEGMWVDPKTGIRTAQPSISAGVLHGAQVIEIRYTDLFGIERGPFTIEFDPAAEGIRETRHSLATDPQWISYRRWAGKLLGYPSMDSRRHAVEGFRYSIDCEDLDREHRFKPPRPSDPFAVDPDDDATLELPQSTRYVAIQVIFRDGTESEVRTFPVPADLPDDN